MMQTPKPHGEFQAPHIDERGILEKLPLRLGNAESLTAMVAEYAFFTPAPLYLLGFFNDAILIDFIFEMRQPITFYHHRFRKPIFSGLTSHDGDTAWDSVLWALNREYWESFVGFMCSTKTYLRSTRILLGIGQQELTIPDPLAVDKAIILSRAAIPLLPISAFGVNSNRFRVAFRSPIDPYRARPYPEKLPAATDVIVYEKALFAGMNPNDARSDYLQGVSHERPQNTP